MPLAPGDVFAGYTVVRQIGSGGMGAVYLVRHPRLPRYDALKLLNRELSAEPDFVARFLREADVVSRLTHRNIVSVYDRGEEAGQLWLSMRFVDGIDVETAIERAGGLLPPARAVHIVSEVAGALDAAHRQHLIHRDVKPANILLTTSDDDDIEQVFLTDFGIAKSLDADGRLTRTGLVVATFDYASPEQIEAEPLDARSDVYSLGCVLYRLLTGAVPFPGPTMLAPAAGHLSLPPPRPTAVVPWLAPALDDVIARAMAKDRAQRFPTCRALATAAASAMHDHPPAPGPPYRVFLSRSGDWSPAGTSRVGPMRTDGIPEEQAATLAALVRRTRFFDLPEQLTDPRLRRPGDTSVTIEIGSTGRAHRIVADMGSARRPPELEDLIATIERMATTVRPETEPAPQPVSPPVPGGQRPGAPVGRTDAAPPAPGGFAYPPLPDVRPVAQAERPPVPQTGPRRVPSGPPTPPPGWPPQGPPPGPPQGPPQGPPPGAPPPGVPQAPVRGPGGPAPRRRGRALLIVVLLLLLVAAGGVTWLVLGRNTDDGGGTTTATTTPAPTTPATAAAEAAYAKLPKSAPLSAAILIAPREVDDNVDLYRVDTVTRTATLLIGGADQEMAPLLSPNRDSVIFVRQHADMTTELRVVAADGTGDQPLFDPPLKDCAKPGRPAWNKEQPSQLALACYDDPNATTLRLVSLDGVTIRTLDAGVAHLEDLSFAPDGSHIAFWGNERTDARAGNIYSLATDDSGKRQTLTTAGTDNDPIWSPDGESIVFSHGRQRLREITLFRLDDQSVEVVVAAEDSVDREPAWSEDGERIVFRSTREGEAPGDQFWIMTKDGDDLTQLTTEGTADSSAAWGYR